MTDNKATRRLDPDPAEEKDVEGHSMIINPTLAADMARSRSRELEREARERNRAKEAKRS